MERGSQHQFSLSLSSLAARGRIVITWGFTTGKAIRRFPTSKLDSGEMQPRDGNPCMSTSETKSRPRAEGRVLASWMAHEKWNRSGVTSERASEQILFADKLQPLVRRRLTSSLFYFIAHSERAKGDQGALLARQFVNRVDERESYKLLDTNHNQPRNEGRMSLALRVV